MVLSKQQLDATECALHAARAVGLYAGWNLSLEDFRARPCADLIEASGEPCPENEGYDTPILTTFCESMRSCLEGRGHQDPRIMMSYLCVNFAGQPATWGAWCDYVAQSLGAVPL